MSAKLVHILGGAAYGINFEPQNNQAIKSFCRDDQVIKDNFHRSRFLILVTNASRGNTYV